MNTRNSILLVAALPILFVGCKKEEPDQVKSAADTTVVEVVTSKLASIAYQDWGTYPADLRGVEDAILVTSAAGTLKSVVEVGSHVKVGQALCDIESDRYHAQLEAARAGTDAAKTAMDVAKRNVEAGSLGRSALDAAAAQYYAANAQYLGAKKQYEDSRCQAPFAGVVASRMVNRWEVVGPGTPTLRIVRNDRLEATFSVPETDAAALKRGQSAEFVLIDNLGNPYPGKVSTIDLAVDSKNRTVSARVVVSNHDGRLRPGLAGKIRLLKRDLKDAIVVPSFALLRREDGVYAMVAEKGKAAERRVVLGSGSGDSVLVESGLKAGDELVVRGAFRLTDGVRVGK